MQIPTIMNYKQYFICRKFNFAYPEFLKTKILLDKMWNDKSIIANW